MSETKRMVCIVCPLGCEGEVCSGADNTLNTRGFGCPRGDQYAKEEFSSPKRMLTTSVRVTGANRNLLPVVSNRAIPKHIVRECAALLAGITVEAPVADGQIIFPDILASGADIIASRELKAVSS